jgi:hypothetical protein
MNVSYYRSPSGCLRTCIAKLCIIPCLLLILLPVVSESSETTAVGDLLAAPSATLQPGELNVSLISNPKLFKYPAGYMRREPVVHRAQQNIFNIGQSFKLPDLFKFRQKAELENYFHTRLSATSGEKK